VFTEESYEAVERFFDEKEAEFIREYWKSHPTIRNFKLCWNYEE